MNIVSLFDRSGNAVRPWALEGFTCYCFDIEQTERNEQYGKGKILYLEADLSDIDVLAYIVYGLQPKFLLGFPPCTHLAVSGAKHFEEKMFENPSFQHEAVDLCRTVEFVGELCECPWFLENPVSRLSTLWRKADHYYHPRDFGGYLSPDDTHPTWPEYIPAQDAYMKLTCGWSGNGFIFPKEKPVTAITSVSENGIKGSMTFKLLGGKSDRTKEIRSETPRGFALAVRIANMPIVLFNAAAQRRRELGEIW